MSRGLFIDVDTTGAVDYITIESAGNGLDFGDFVNERFPSALSNGTNDRGIFQCGDEPNTNVIHYVTISTTGNSTNFGEMSVARYQCAGTSNFTGERGVFAGGLLNSVYYNTIDYITINSASTAVDFGDLTIAVSALGAASAKGRAVFGGGTTGSVSAVISYVSFTTLNSTSSFGQLTEGRSLTSATSNDTNERGIFIGGVLGDTSFTNTIDYITISTLSDATNFGDQAVTRNQVGATSNGSSNRGVYAGGIGPPTDQKDEIDYVTISTASNASSFGSLSTGSQDMAGTSNAGAGTGTIATALNKWMGILETNIPKMLGITRSTTQLSKLMGLTLTDYVVLLDRGVFGSGYTWTGTVRYNTIDYITISTTGNATDYGDLLATKYGAQATSNGGSDRGVFGGSYTTSAINVIEYLTISTTGNSQDFGDLTVARERSGSASNKENQRGTFGGGNTSGPTANNTIDYITINSAGNATDFGDVSVTRAFIGGTSNA